MTLRGAVAWRALVMSVATVVVSLAVTTAAVYLVQDRAGVSDASTLYLLAVAVVAYMRGSWAAIGAAIGAFLTYNFLFLPPRFTFVVSDPQHILTLILLLMVGGGIGWLNGLQRDQALRSSRREHEARALFGVSRAIASAKRMTDALPVLVAALATDARMARVWIGLGATWAQEQVVATSDPMANAPVSGPHSVRRPGADASQPAWVRLSPPGPPQWHRDNLSLFRLELTDGETTLGSLWAARDPHLGPPTAEETRLLSAAADQIGQGIVRDRLSEQATELEVARRSEELKAALLDSVSHDLRTPLSTIRATAGSLADPNLDLPRDEQREMAREIDAEADRLSLLVSGLLDMTRIEGGALKPTPEPMPFSEIVQPALHRARASLGMRPVEVQLPDTLPALAVDPVLANQVIDNLLENVVRHTAADDRVRITAVRDGEDVRVRVEDAGPGVPNEALGHLFEKFYRVPPRRSSARLGTGLGLAVVKGMVEAMGGSVAASPSTLGGLAIDLRLPIAPEPPLPAEPVV
jgi:two-component system sensor histidine kinase KdpD